MALRDESVVGREGKGTKALRVVGWFVVVVVRSCATPVLVPCHAMQKWGVYIKIQSLSGSSIRWKIIVTEAVIYIPNCTEKKCSSEFSSCYYIVHHYNLTPALLIILCMIQPLPLLVVKPVVGRKTILIPHREDSLIPLQTLPRLPLLNCSLRCWRRQWRLAAICDV